MNSKNSNKENLSGPQIAQHNDISRRTFFYRAAAPLAVTALPQFLWAGETGSAQGVTPLTKMGIASTSFMGVELGPGQATGGARPATASGTPAQGAAGGRPRGRDAYEFLEKCHALGAGGVQTQLNGDLSKLRARAEQLGMWLEGMVSIPRNGDAAGFERSLMDAKAAGATVVRTAMLPGRRYETFQTLAEWKKWVDESHEALRLILPILERQKIYLALENHKDWTLEEMQRLLRTYSSEYLGVCLDFGNNIALLDDPMEVIETLAPYTKSTHVKDMGVRPYADGFLMSEVTLGTGFLDLPRIVSLIQKANPKVNFSLEMITRDPLKIPCMTPQYWTVFPERNGKYLARTFRLVRDQSNGGPLPTVSQLSREERAKAEEDNVKACIQYARAKQLIA